MHMAFGCEDIPENFPPNLPDCLETFAPLYQLSMGSLVLDDWTLLAAGICSAFCNAAAVGENGF